MIIKTTVTIDDELYNKADLFHEAIRTFVRVKFAKRLSAAGASMPELPDVPWRRPDVG